MEHSSNSTASTAHEYARRGWRVIPVYRVNTDGSCACGRRDLRIEDGVEVDKHAIGKHPIGKRWQERASTSGADIEEWFATNPPNLGIATGQESGIFVLDVDPEHGGDDTLSALEKQHGRLPSTYAVETGSGGTHFYFPWPGFEVSNSAGRLGEGLDIRGNGGQVVAPPSVSGSGPYRVLNEVEVAPAPAWLLELIRKDPAPLVVPSTVERLAEAPDGYVETALSREVSSFSLTLEGGRNDALNRAAFNVATMVPHGVITPDDIISAFTPVALDLGLDAEETRKTLESAITAGIAKPRDWPPPVRSAATFIPFENGDSEGEAWPKRSWDDFGNAARLLDHHPDRLLWVEQAERWATYDETRWALDTNRTAQTLAQETIHALPATEAFSYPADDVFDEKKGLSTRDAFVGWAKGQRYSGKVRAMLETARGVRGLSAEITDFDSDPMLLNCRNGVLDLRSSELLEHSPRLLQMQQVNADYDPGAQCPRWEAFLEKMQPNPDVRAYLQRVVGYSLTGDISEQKLFMHLGEGANGKSVFLEVLTGLLGSYAQAVPRTTLIVTKNESIPNDVARMVGKRFLQTSETKKGVHLDEETVKGLTGGEEQSARFMRAEFFDFKPTGKIHYVTNHFPVVSNAASIWRRLVVLRWGVTIADDDPARDKHLGSKIVASELPGVLAWAVRGLAEWRVSGLEPPALVAEWGREYRDDSDEFGEFVEECLVVGGGDFTPTQRLYDAYSAWVFRGGRGRPMGSKSFSLAMKERGFNSIRSRVGEVQSRGFIGVSPRISLNMGGGVTDEGPM